MKVTKRAQAVQAVLQPGHLEDINRLSRTPLTQEEVYAFPVRLCDNEVDRDGERFAPKTLEQLAPMFVGKSGIFDHNWSAQGQAARIYRTEVAVEPGRLTQAGDPYCWLKGYAYMVRTPENHGLIAEIEGGIKKEVSVACSVERAVCSICGAPRGEGCGHRPGEVYDGKLCYISLEEASDAYEFSFVAVPAQPRAGVVKGFSGGQGAASLKELVQGNTGCARELEALEHEAALGRKWLSSLRADVVRLGGLADPKLDLKVLKAITEKLEEGELQELKRTYEARAQERYPLTVQLGYGKEPERRPEEDGAFLI